MTRQTAGSARYKLRAASMRRRLSVALIVIVVLVVAAIVARTFIFPKASKPVVAAKPPVLSLAGEQSADVGLVAGAVGQYAAANDALPTHLSATSSGGLVLCGDVCNAALYRISGFNAYEASNIHLKSYAPGLTAPNQNVMYLVPGAKCGSNGQLGAVNSTPRSMVLLYASANTTGATPRCVVL